MLLKLRLEDSSSLNCLCFLLFAHSVVGFAAGAGHRVKNPFCKSGRRALNLVSDVMLVRGTVVALIWTVACFGRRPQLSMACCGLALRSVEHACRDMETIALVINAITQRVLLHVHFQGI